MNDKPNQIPASIEQTTVQHDGSDVEVLKIAARRRLLKKVAVVGVPVITTLASRPVLAWHCRTPSMWGSMVMNVNTSLRTNAGHETGLADETWTIQNWGFNTQRNSVRGGVTPWAYIKSQGITFAGSTYNYAKKTTQPSGPFLQLRANPASYLDLSVLKVIHLCSATGVNPAGVAGTEVVSTFFTTKWQSFDAHIIVAQLNKKYIGANLNNCLGTLDLPSIAQRRSATVNGMTWDTERIIDFLQNNWIVVPYDGYISWSTGNVNGDIGHKFGEVPSGQAKGQDYHYFSYPIEK